MNSYVYPSIEVKKVGAKGLGSVTTAPLKKGEVVIVQGGKIERNAPDNSNYNTYFDTHCFQIDEEFLICPIDEQLDGIFRVNHSCDPACGFTDQLTVVAMRDIAEGEEITYDYAMTDMDTPDMTAPKMECLCDTPGCRKVITGEDWKLPALQQKYKGYFSPHIRAAIERLG